MGEQKFTIFHGLKCLIGEKIDKTHYALIPWEGTIEELNNDLSFTEYTYWRALAIQINCSCGKDFFYDDIKIFEGETYECSCPICGNIVKTTKNSKYIR